MLPKEPVKQVLQNLFISEEMDALEFFWTKPT